MHPAATQLLQREQYVQRTPGWYVARQTLLTASDAAAALSIKPYPSYRGSPRTEALRKKATNEPVSNMFVAHGQKYEDEARDWISAALGETVMDVGLVVHATEPWLGASPDGLTCSGKLLEIKCPLKREIRPGHVPEHYYAQMQVQMEVCDVDTTIFGEYKPSFLSAAGKAALSVVVVQRDREWFRTHRDALHAFWEEFMEARRRGCYVAAEAPACLIEDGLYEV